MSKKLITPEQRLTSVGVTCAHNSKDLGWGKIRAEDYPHLEPNDIRCSGMDAHLLVYHYKALDGIFLHECAGKRTNTRLIDGQLSFIPAGADNRWSFGKGGPGALHVMIDETYFNQCLFPDHNIPSSFALRDEFQVTSAEMQALATLFAAELKNGGLNGPMYVEALGIALSQLLVRHFGALELRQDHRSLRPNLNRAVELIRHEYSRAIPLGELANLANLSKAQLVREFRRNFGIPPHRYLIEHRIKLAKENLRSSRTVSLATLAFDLGFYDQSHFHRHFRNITGVSPVQYQRDPGSR